MANYYCRKWQSRWASLYLTVVTSIWATSTNAGRFCKGWRTGPC